MQPRVAQLVSYLDVTRDRLLNTVTPLTPVVAAMKVRADTWSAEENVAHLAIVEDRVAALVSKSVAWAKANGIGPATSDASFMSSLDKFGVTDAKFKLEAPSTVAPDARPIADSLAALASSRARLKDALIDGDALDLAQVKRTHQAMGDLDLYQWALFVAQHEERHRRQIEKTLGDAMELAAECAPIV